VSEKYYEKLTLYLKIILVYETNNANSSLQVAFQINKKSLPGNCIASGA
jgi:hypothetical protein